jgi:hypothetical protein
MFRGSVKSTSYPFHLPIFHSPPPLPVRHSVPSRFNLTLLVQMFTNVPTCCENLNLMSVKDPAAGRFENAMSLKTVCNFE